MTEVVFFVCRIIAEKPKEVLFTKPRKYIQCWSQDSTETGYVNIKELAEAMCRYDLDDMDLYWLQQLNADLGMMGKREEMLPYKIWSHDVLQGIKYILYVSFR